MPANSPDVVCIGSVLWDIIGCTTRVMSHGADVPGGITRLPGGVAMNVAVTLRRLGLSSTLLSAIGRDAVGEELRAACQGLGVNASHIYRSESLPTDRYIAIEDTEGLVGAIADARSIEAAGDRILEPLVDGRLGTPDRPWSGLVVLDGNLTESVLAEIASAPYIAAADLRVASASPGKVERLRPLLAHPRVTFYVNIVEANLLSRSLFADSIGAAEGLLACGARRVLVTDGARECADAMVDGTLTSRPRAVVVNRVTGAGDTFMAAHIVAERRGMSRMDALQFAHGTASDYVAGKIGT